MRKNWQNLKDVLFNDKSRGIVDLELVVRKDHRPIIKELIDLKKFRDFRVDMDTVVWNNGFDLAPEFLYSHLQKPKHLQKKKKTRTRIAK
ncbi:MAG: DUF2442 domain-containing protein [Gammaproteobacteria bacterium]|nr:DUF2442 domain-containing protein [Gammaproteobacteria bacterium]